MSLCPLRPCLPRGRTALALLVLGLAASAAPTTPVARAGDAPGAPAPQAAAPAASSRMTAVELEIRALERRLTALRRVRTDLHAGRGETLAADAEARRALDGDLRAVREVFRYEAGRTKALAALDQALASKDETRIAEARTALDALDTRFADALRKLEEARDATDAPAKGATKAAGGADDGDRPKKPSKAAPKAPAGDGMVAGDDLEGDPMADEGDEVDEAL